MGNPFVAIDQIYFTISSRRAASGLAWFRMTPSAGWPSWRSRDCVQLPGGAP